MNVFFVALIGFSCMIWSTNQQECHTREIGICILPTLMESRRAIIPKDEKALNRSCQIWLSGQRCMEKYEERCLNIIHREVADVITERSERIQRELCGENRQLRNDFLKAAPCLSEVVKLSQESCMDGLENALHLLTREELEEGINAGCCFYERFYRCYRKHLNKRCEPQHLPVIEETSKMVYLEALHTICRSSDPDSAMCFELLSRNVTSSSEEGSYLARLMLLYLNH